MERPGNQKDLTDAQLAQRLQEIEFEDAKEKSPETGVIFRDDGKVEVLVNNDVMTRLYKVMEEQRLSSMDETVEYLMKQFSENQDLSAMDIS